MSKMITKGNDASGEGRVEARPQGIFVLGMHRSGTSACTRVLNILGCALSDQLLGAADGNEAGHWESIEAVSLDDEILSSAGSSHDDWGAINPDWRQSAIRSQMIGRASEILASHAEHGPLFAIKDPRMCRLADVWLEAAEQAGIEPLVLLMLRNPAEVAASLETRDLMVPGYAELLWLRHVIDAEYLTRGQRRVVFRYDQLMANWQALIMRIKNGFGITFPRNSPKAHAEIEGFLQQSQRHHFTAFEAVFHNPIHLNWLLTTLQIMLGWSENSEDTGDYAALDQVRAEMDHGYSTFARFLLNPSLTGSAGAGLQLRAELTSLREESERKTEALQLAMNASENLRIANEQREAELAAQMDAETSRARELESENERLGSEIEALRTEMAERTDGLVRLQSDLGEANAEAGAERKRRAEAEETSLKASRELHEKQILNAELTGQVSALKSSLVQRPEELGQLLRQFHETERARALAEAESQRERELRIKYELHVARADTEISALQTDLNEARSTANKKVEAMSTDLAELTILLQKQEEATEKAERDKAESAAEITRLSEKARKLGEAVCTAETAKAETEKELSVRISELAQLASIVAVETDRADDLSEQTRWLAAVRRLEDGFPAWWAIMPPLWRQLLAHRRYFRAGLFDADAYRTLYPDVAENVIDPIRHYILHGMSEGRVRTVPV